MGVSKITFNYQFQLRRDLTCQLRINLTCNLEDIKLVQKTLIRNQYFQHQLFQHFQSHRQRVLTFNPGDIRLVQKILFQNQPFQHFQGLLQKVLTFNLEDIRPAQKMLTQSPNSKIQFHLWEKTSKLMPGETRLVLKIRSQNRHSTPIKDTQKLPSQIL